MTTSAQDDRRVPTKAKVEHPSVAERVARGQAARAEVPRSTHAEFDPGPDRPDPVALLERQAATRVPELVPIRYGRMLVSPFTFYRGAALIMASDLATTPTTGLRVQLCGDAHLSNFGVFGTPERRLVFDLNDFDETLPGPFEWDVKRLAASLEVAGRDRGFADADRDAIVRACSRALPDRDGRVRRQAQPRRLVRPHSTSTTSPATRADRLAQGAEASRRRASPRRAPATACRRWRSSPTMVDGAAAHHRRPAADRCPMRRSAAAATRPRPSRTGSDARLREYRRTLQTDRAAPARAATGFVDARPQGGGRGQRRDARLDRAAARPRRRRPAVPADQGGAALGARGVRRAQRLPQRRPARGRRAAAHAGGQRHVPRAGSATTASTAVERDFYVRQLRDWKGSAEIEAMVPEGMRHLRPRCAPGPWPGPTPARATGSRSRPISARSDAFDHAIAVFAAAYADRNERDYELLKEAVASGRLEAQTGL